MTVENLSVAVYGYTLALLDRCYGFYVDASSSQTGALDEKMRQITDPDGVIKCIARTSTSVRGITNKCTATGPHPHILFPPLGSCISEIQTTNKKVIPGPERLLLSDILRPDLTLPRIEILKGLHLTCETVMEPLALVDPAGDLADLGGVYPVLFVLCQFFLCTYAKSAPVRYGSSYVASVNIEMRGSFTVSFTPHVVRDYEVLFVHALSWTTNEAGLFTDEKYPSWATFLGQYSGPTLHHAHFAQPLQVVWTPQQIRGLQDWMNAEGNTMTKLFNLLRLGDTDMRFLYPTFDFDASHRWTKACPLPLFVNSDKGTRAAFVVYEIPCGASSVVGIASEPCKLDVSLSDLGAVLGSSSTPKRKARDE